MKKICPQCGGSGTLPEEPKTPEVITVRIKRCNHGRGYQDLIGLTVSVVEDINLSLYQRIDKRRDHLWFRELKKAPRLHKHKFNEEAKDNIRHKLCDRYLRERRRNEESKKETS